MTIWNWFKKEKEPVVEWWSDIDELNDPSLDFLRPQKANKFFPAWFKKVQADVNDNIFHHGTIKKCPVFPEFLTQGYVIPLWCDVELYYDTIDGREVFEWKTPTKRFSWDIHSRDQYLDYLPEEEQNKWGFIWKSECPWRVRTPKGYSMYQLPLWYHFQEFSILPGSVRTDFNYILNQQVLAPMAWKGKRIRLERGTPFVWYIPYRRTSYSHEYVPLTAERQRMNDSLMLNIRSKFSGAYKEHAKREDMKK